MLKLRPEEMDGPDFRRWCRFAELGAARQPGIQLYPEGRAVQPAAAAAPVDTPPGPPGKGSHRGLGETQMVAIEKIS